jgi:hypothetical protein
MAEKDDFVRLPTKDAPAAAAAIVIEPGNAPEMIPRILDEILKKTPTKTAPPVFVPVSPLVAEILKKSQPKLYR